MRVVRAGDEPWAGAVPVFDRRHTDLNEVDARTLSVSLSTSGRPPLFRPPIASGAGPRWPPGPDPPGSGDGSDQIRGRSGPGRSTSGAPLGAVASAPFVRRKARVATT